MSVGAHEANSAALWFVGDLVERGISPETSYLLALLPSLAT